VIVNIKKGKSFVGAGRYYLHDKTNEADKEKSQEHLTSDERVAWTDTRNCANTDPQLALVEMWKTADDQMHLKVAAGQNLGGRKTQDPVKTISLSWHPTEAPTPEQMIAAADSYLEQMGWSEHQAVYIGHDDTKHPHMHIVLNRVHPETGRTLDDYNDHKHARTWALDYERDHGKVWCEKRLETEHEPGRAANTNMPHNVVALTREAEQQFQHAEVSGQDLDIRERAELKREQREEREVWFEAGRAIIKDARHAVYDAVRDDFKDTWRDYYRERTDAEAEAAKASGSAIGRAIVFARAGEFGEAWSALGDRDALVKSVAQEFDARRADIVAAQREDVRERQDIAIAALMEERREGYQDLLARQQAERTELKIQHAQGERAPEGQTRPSTEANNENAAPAARNTTDRTISAPPMAAPEVKAVEHAVLPSQLPEPVDHSVVLVDQETKREEKKREGQFTQVADLGAGMIGSVASYLADQLAETFAPTPPEVREAQARAAAAAQEKADSERPANPYARHIGEADQKVLSEREQQESDRYWDEERERRRER
jgi:hypothetical protein